jgi:hypothetical protein
MQKSKEEVCDSILLIMMNMYYPHSPSLEEIGEKPIKFYKNVRVRA